MKARPLLERFTEKIEKAPDGCWLWRGGVDKETGYGKIGTSAYVVTGAHRVSYKLFVGDIPEGLDVCHKCSVRRCVNPDHLYAGTRKENMQQALRENRLGRNARDY